MKLRTIGMAAVAALSLVAGRAEAQDAGWDTQYGILFTLPNPFQGGGKDLISDFQGKVGLQYNLSPEAGLRLGLNLRRASKGITETKSGGVTSKTVASPWSSEYDANLSGEYMLRLSPAAVAGYVGAGAFVNLSYDRKKGEDTVTGVTAITEYNNSATTIGLGVMGTAGLEWRVSKVIALFAEYQADLTLISRTSSKTDQTLSGTAQKSDSKEMHFLNLSTGIANGGKLGLIAFF